MDCFVSCFRITPHNNQHFKVTSQPCPWSWRRGALAQGFCLLQVCLASSSPSTFHFVLVNSLHRIITNVSVRSSSPPVFDGTSSSHLSALLSVPPGLVAKDRRTVLLLWRASLYVLRHAQPGDPRRRHARAAAHDNSKRTRRGVSEEV